MEKGAARMSAGFVPWRMFFTKGVGRHPHKLSSFELALRNAGIEKANLVRVSSIFPPGCKIITRRSGEKLLKAGEIVFVVLADSATDEPNRLIAASVGLATPRNKAGHGYLSEHHSYGETEKKAGDFAEDLAATMLATTMGLDFDPEKAWREREQYYKASGHILQTRHITQSAEGHKDGWWTTVVAAGVFVP